jgi:sugar lactone lactonase YvrE
MRSPSVTKSSLVVAAVLAVGLAVPAGRAQQAEVTIESGVRVVRNPAAPVKGADGKIATVSLVEDLVIGDDTSREDHWFGFLNALDVDAEGRIYTVDPKSVRIRIFGPGGELVKAFGQSGQGPGEFSGPGGIVAAPDGTFVVSDVLNGRLSYFSRDGAHLKDKLFGTYRLAGLVIDEQGNLFITNVHPPSGDTQVWELLKLGPDMEQLATIHALSIPFRRRAVPMIPPRLFYGRIGRDRLAWMVSTAYEITEADGSGQTIRRIFKDAAVRKITEADRAAILKDRFPTGAMPQLEEIFPENFPCASALMTDEKGRIYVRTYETNGKVDSAVDVFDTGGLYVARFFVPEDEETITVRNDKLYVLVKESAAGNPLVKRYAIVWK